MKALAICLLSVSAAAAEPNWVVAKVLVVSGEKALVMLDSADPSKLRLHAPGPKGSPVKLAIELDNIEAGKSSPWLRAPGLLRSITRTEDTTITRTVLVDRKERAIFVHLLADKPGALSFRVGLGESAKVENRRELVSAVPTPCRVTVWPFESDVTPGKHGISVRGEGEALIVWNFGPANLWDELANRHDPGGTPPNPAKIWQGLFDEHTSQPAAAPVKK